MIERHEPRPVEVSNIVYPKQNKVDEQTLKACMRTYVVSAASRLSLVFQNSEGTPYDLSDGGFQFKAGIQEMVTGGSRKELEVTVHDPEHGELLIFVPASLTPGAYRGLVVMEEDGTPILTNTFRLMISRDGAGNAPSVEEIRLLIRDTMPAESLLLESRAFTDAEILASMERAIRYWNETPPFLGVLSTQSFPWKHHLIEGILGQLYLVAAEDFRKNELQYSAGGLSVADKSKEQNYQRASAYHWDQYRKFVDEKKSELNAMQAWSIVESPCYYI